MRRPGEFIVWNHIFMAYETYRSMSCDKVLFFMALPCTILSVVRHVYRERCCNVTEPVLAKSTMVYLLVASFAINDPSHVATMMLIKAVIVFVWLAEDKDYERIHPWLHVLVAADAHYYIDCITSG